MCRLRGLIIACMPSFFVHDVQQCTGLEHGASLPARSIDLYASIIKVSVRTSSTDGKRLGLCLRRLVLLP